MQMFDEYVWSNKASSVKCYFNARRIGKNSKNLDVNKQWEMMLSNVYGVYLIFDTTNG